MRKFYLHAELFIKEGGKELLEIYVRQFFPPAPLWGRVVF